MIWFYFAVIADYGFMVWAEIGDSDCGATWGGDTSSRTGAWR